ncbi:alkaline phosphatase family protein [Kutzneria chonburiensis]|uniref:Alkaline phosphatase family protein n=1 Tax=Kutzneria chonburiensis TaxID=1483604 RepID=A0ABV6MUW7_9PSEU|nr:alkaline phosphatase family protein [Kutzneria chonburiensis]
MAITLAGAPAFAATSSGNLIVGGDAEAGYCTNDWHAATTVPGWTVTAGSPDVICYSAGSFGHPANPLPGKAFLAPGDQGDGTISQTVDVSSAAAAIDGGGVTYDLSGWLGGWTTYAGYAGVSAQFLDGSAHQLGTTAQLPTVSESDRGGTTEFLARDVTGAVPAGTRSVLVQVRFVNSSGESGYADNLSLTLSTPVRQPVLTPPPSQVPGYDHVFTVMMENTNYSAIMNDTTDTPYLHSLMAQGTLMANYHAVYHPSDENYLAIAGGDTYATGATYFPNINDPNAHLGDKLEAAGKSWKAYEQGMGTPCNTTTQYDKYYEPDDAPFINYTNVSGNSARCQAHLFDTNQLTTDLASASTTPAFSWLAADDYYDGEASGNGSAASLKVQDGWLKQTLDPIVHSPAWTTQRSLLIVTWDENASGVGNQVATIVVGSQGTVPAGRVSTSRYDHYGTGRTIEAALGLPAITANDRYATPLDDAFTTTTAGSTLTGGPSTFQYSTPAATVSDKNWIGIYPVGVQPGSQPSTTWQYAPGAGGSLTFSLSAGTYAAWYLYNDGYTALAGPVTFTVS